MDKIEGIMGPRLAAAIMDSFLFASVKAFLVNGKESIGSLFDGVFYDRFKAGGRGSLRIDSYTERYIQGSGLPEGLYGGDIYGKPFVSEHLFFPVGKKIGVTVITADVIHSFGLPCMGVKADAVPGRENTCYVSPKIVGYFEGNCYELCGVEHSIIIISGSVISEFDYQDILVSFFIEEIETYPCEEDTSESFFIEEIIKEEKEETCPLCEEYGPEEIVFYPVREENTKCGTY